MGSNSIGVNLLLCLLGQAFLCSVYFV